MLTWVRKSGAAEERITHVLLYAQPASHIVRLSLDDVIRDGGEILLRLGEPPSPVPGPVADLLVVADALGYHPVTTARLAAQAGGAFSRYAPGDHARPAPSCRPSKGEP